MPLKTFSKFEPRTLSVVLILAVTLLVQCGKKPGHDKTPYLLKKKLRLTNEQAGEVETIINGIKDLREKDRKRYEGDNQSLLKAARERRSLGYEKIESVLDESQKARFRQVMAEKEVADRTLIIADRVGLDSTTTERIDRIVVKSPTEEEVIAARESGDTARIQALKEETDRIQEEIESFMNDEQKIVFEKMIQEKVVKADRTRQVDD